MKPSDAVASVCCDSAIDGVIIARDGTMLVRGQPTITFGTNDLSHTAVYSNDSGHRPQYIRVIRGARQYIVCQSLTYYIVSDSSQQTVQANAKLADSASTRQASRHSPRTILCEA